MAIMAAETHPRTEKTFHDISNANRATVERIADQAATINIYAFVTSADSKIGPCVAIHRNQLTELLDALEKRPETMSLKLSYWPGGNLFIR